MFLRLIRKREKKNICQQKCATIIVFHSMRKSLYIFFQTVPCLLAAHLTSTQFQQNHCAVSLISKRTTISILSNLNYICVKSKQEIVMKKKEKKIREPRAIYPPSNLLAAVRLTLLNFLTIGLEVVDFFPLPESQLFCIFIASHSALFFFNWLAKEIWFFSQLFQYLFC